MTGLVRISLLAATFALLSSVASSVASPREASAAEPRTWNYLTTGNGHGFQVYDAQKHKITDFLEHPYRYLAPRPDPKSDGFGRRNLAFDFFFGVGGTASGWLVGTGTDVAYLDESNIIRATYALSKGGATQGAEAYYFAPYGYSGNAMVAILKAPGATNGFALMNFHMGNGSPEPDANGESLRQHGATKAVIETGPGGGAMIYVPFTGLDHTDCTGAFDAVQAGRNLGDDAACSGNDVVPAFQAKLVDGWMAMGVQFVANAADADAAATALAAWGGGRTADKILGDARAEWDAWRKPPPAEVICNDDERKVWRQGEATLRMGQVLEPNTPTRKNHGMVLASLPRGEWHSSWVRDGVYGIVAFARMGHLEEARLGLEFFFNAEPVGKYKQFVSNSNYRVSVVRYFGNGEEEADYSGQPTPNIETDGWGLVLWGARQYLEASGDLAWLDKPTRDGTIYEVLTKGIGKPIAENLEPNGVMKADSSIWEVHDANKRHFAYTTMTAARGLCDLAAMAEKGGHGADAETWRGLAKKVRGAFLQTFVDPQGALGGSLEGLSTNKYYDGAVAEAFTWNLLQSFSDDTAKATLDVLEKLRVSSGGYKRNNDGLSTYDDNEWILVDLRIADSLRRAGKTAEAAGVVKLVTDKAVANFDLLPELFNAVAADGQIGKYTGSIPMVGYGGGAYAMTLLDRAGFVEKNDCGDGRGAVLPKITCTGEVITEGNEGAGKVEDIGAPGSTPGSGSSGGAASADDVPYVGACLCRLGAPSHASGGLVLAVLVPLALFVFRVEMPRRRRRLVRRDRSSEFLG
ncbi:MAG: hypothetical protein U0169_00080 [Polyangiaceae bacterium]